jgi:hypothetical protein
MDRVRKCAYGKTMLQLREEITEQLLATYPRCFTYELATILETQPARGCRPDYTETICTVEILRSVRYDFMREITFSRRLFPEEVLNESYDSPRWRRCHLDCWPDAPHTTKTPPPELARLEQYFAILEVFRILPNPLPNLLSENYTRIRLTQRREYLPIQREVMRKYPRLCAVGIGELYLKQKDNETWSWFEIGNSVIKPADIGSIPYKSAEAAIERAQKIIETRHLCKNVPL